MASTKYKSGDKVFAKVRGYPFWPARVEACADETPNKMKYHVYFYGTAETAICKAEELASYADNKDKYGKPLKRKGFNEGLQQIETEINGGIAVPFTFTENAEDDPDPDNDSSSFPDDNSSVTSAPGGFLEKKKKPLTSVKRKRESMDSLSEDAEMKRKQARLSLSTGQTLSNASGHPASDGDSPNSKVKAVSRSGRKIKPKKFADDDDDRGEDVDHGLIENGVSAHSEISSSLIVNSAISDGPVNKVRKSQGSSRLNTFSTHPFSDESAKAVGDGKVGISSENPNRAILARALSGHYVKIKLDDERPAHFEDDRARQLWDAATARNAERLKAQIELGEYLPEVIKKQLEGKAELTDAQKKEIKKEAELARKRGKLRWLKQEAHLLELDAQIRSSLSLAKADTRRCLSLMDDMLLVNIDPLMLKKHPNIVETVKKLQKYIGNVSKWNLTEDEVDKFKASCEQIRTKASHMYHKFKKLFAVPANKSFWDVFAQEVDRFNEAVKHMTRDKMYALVTDPEKLDTFDDSDEDEYPRQKSLKSPKSKHSPSSFKESTLNGDDIRTEAESTS